VGSKQEFLDLNMGGWSLAADVKAEIDRVLRERITDPVGPEFMAPPARYLQGPQ